MSDRGSFRPGRLVRLLGRMLAWAQERDQARIRRDNPAWWARVQAMYRGAGARAE